MANFLGILIRRERLRQNYSQEGLCRGICAVSYLSKIEQGKAEAGNDILLPLLERLGIEYETDQEFLTQAGEIVERQYRDVYAGKYELRSFGQDMDWLLERRDRLLRSPYMLDALLLCSPSERVLPEPQLADFVPCMTRRQYAFYLLRALWSGERDTGEELLRLDPCALHTEAVGIETLERGRYTEAAQLLGRSYDLAAQEGHVHLMLLAKLYLGNCYSGIGSIDQMNDAYATAKSLAETVQYTELLPRIDYNIAATYLEYGRVREAYDLFMACTDEDMLYFHKVALCLERMGRLDEARETLAKAYTAEVPATRVLDHVYRRLLDPVQYRLDHPDYLHDDNYAALVWEVFTLVRKNLPDGFTRAMLLYVLEMLEGQRRYKEAYQLLREFSNIPLLGSI